MFRRKRKHVPYVATDFTIIDALSSGLRGLTGGDVAVLHTVPSQTDKNDPRGEALIDGLGEDAIYIEAYTQNPDRKVEIVISRVGADRG